MLTLDFTVTQIIISNKQYPASYNGGIAGHIPKSEIGLALQVGSIQ